jgi:nicotinate-nucleotide adenylyltransferase
VELHLVIGADVAAELHTWVRVDELRERCTLAVVRRPGALADGPTLSSVATPGWRRVDVDVPALDVSSTDLRDRLAAGRPIDVLVPPKAVHEIARRGLYAPLR